MEMFYFSRSHKVFKPLSLNLIPLEGSILQPKNTWWYLGFIFDKKLTFWQHINFYANKAILTIKYMKMLRNSLRELIPTQKQLLYRSYILSIALYGFQLWYYNKAPLFYFFKELRKIWRKAIIWILGAFCISPTLSIEAIARLILIHLYL